MMNREPRDAFVKALRSGDYRKGTILLCEAVPGRGDCYCAVGVLTEVARAAGVEVKKTFVEEGALANAYIYDGNSAFIPDAVAEWAGIDIRVGFKLSNMNDNGKSFNQIADYVEENL